MKAMKAADLRSAGAELTSRFHQLVAGKRGKGPGSAPLATGPVCAKTAGPIRAAPRRAAETLIRILETSPESRRNGRRHLRPLRRNSLDSCSVRVPDQPGKSKRDGPGSRLSPGASRLTPNGQSHLRADRQRDFRSAQKVREPGAEDSRALDVERAVRKDSG